MSAAHLSGCHRDDVAASGTTADREYRVLQKRSDRLMVELPNRMIVIVQEVRAAPVVTAQVWIKTGSIYEQEHIGAGLSHFLEHLASGGSTSTRSEDESSAILGRIGAQTNASTGLDTVRYYINTTAEHTGAAIGLLSDWMRNSLITSAEYERERDVIQREFEMGVGDPGRILWKTTQQARYLANPARHPTIGYIDEFMSVSRDEIFDFYKRMYVPNNMVFVVVGDVDKDAVVNQVTAFWAGVPVGELPKLSFPIESEDAPRQREFTAHADIRRPRLRLVFPGTVLGESGDYELDLLAIILGQGESSRLVRTVRDQLRLVNTIDAFNWSTNWGKGFFGVDCELADADGSIDQIKQQILAQIAELRDEPVTDVELARAKRKVMARVVQSNQTVQSIAGRLARDVIGIRDPDYLTRYSDAIQSLKASALRDAANRFLSTDRLIVVRLLPLPEGQTVELQKRAPASADPGEFEQKPVDLDNATIVSDLMANLSKVTDAARPIQVGPLMQYELSNGLRLLVRRSTVVPGVAMQMYWLGGLLADEPGREGVANAAATMLRRGTATHSAQQIAEAIEDLGASLHTNCGNNTSFASATALKDDWPAVLKLLADVVQQPSFPDDEWAKMQPRILASIDRQRDQWHTEIRLHFAQAYYGEHAWSQPSAGRREVVEALTADDLRAFHTDHLDARQAVLSVVGDVVPQNVRDEAERLFAAMPADASNAFNPARPLAPESHVSQVSTQKRVAAVVVGFGPGMTRDAPNYATMVVLARLMSDFPSGWLEQELRGKGPGLVYAVGAGPRVGLVPGHFSVLFNTQPSQAVEALSRTFDVVERAKSGEIDEQALARAKAKVLSEELLAKQSNASLATEAALDQLYGVEDPDMSAFIAQVNAADADALHAVARQYLRNPIVVVLSHEPVDKAAVQRLVDQARGR